MHTRISHKNISYFLCPNFLEEAPTHSCIKIPTHKRPLHNMIFIVKFYSIGISKKQTNPYAFIFSF